MEKPKQQRVKHGLRDGILLVVAELPYLRNGMPDAVQSLAGMMRRFKWIDWNLRKIDDHGLSPAEVEGAFDRVLSLRRRREGSFEMFAATPSGRRVWVIWRYDREDD